MISLTSCSEVDVEFYITRNNTQHEKDISQNLDISIDNWNEEYIDVQL